MKLVKLKVVNFGSFKELDYDFTDSPVLIQGQNYTDENQESNGSGKSFITAAIEFCLFKTTSRNVRDIELIYTGELKAETYLSISCPIRNELLEIERRISKKGGGEAQVSLNGKVVYSFEDKVSSEVDKYIVNWIGITKEDLQNYYIVNKERYRSIFSSSNKEKVDLINRFSNASLIKGVDKFVDEEVVVIESEIKKINDSILQKNSSIETLQSEIQSELSRDLEAEKKIKVDRINDEINSLTILIEKSNKGQRAMKADLTNNLLKIPEFESKLEKVNKIIAGFKGIDVSEELQPINRELSEIESRYNVTDERLKKDKLEVRLIEKSISDIEKNLMGVITCPNCSHNFIPGREFSFENAIEIKTENEELVGLLNKSISITLDKLNQFERDIQILSNKRDDVKKKTKFNDRCNERLRKIKNNIKDEIDHLSSHCFSMEKEVRNRELDIKHSNERIDLLKGQLIVVNNLSIDKERIDSINQKIIKFNEEIVLLNSSLTEKKEELFNTTQWKSHFKKFDMFLANNSLKVIQGYCNKFLQELKSDIQVKWEGKKVLASGDTRDEVTSYILRDGEQRNFWSFSGGERARMEYAMIFTLQEMINQTHKYSGLQFLSTDEIAEGIDPQGLSDLMKSFPNNKTVMITTHVVSKNISDNILMVKKENNISQIIKN